MNNRRGKLPPITALRPFEAAARLGGFTRAAEELHLTQAAISHQIRNLEEDLGCKLFDRRNRTVVLTAEGRAFARTVAEAMDDIAAHAARLRGNRRAGEVVFFAQLCEAMYWVMPRLGAFRQAHPEIHVNVVSSPRALGDYEGEFDVALQIADRSSGGMRPVLTVPDEVFALCSPGFLDGLQKPLSRDDLGRLTLLYHKTDPRDWPGWDDWFARVGSECRIGEGGIPFEDYLFMIQSAIEGQGVVLGWRRTMERLIEFGALVRAVPDSVPLSDGLLVYCQPSERDRPETKAVLDWLKAELAAQDR